jgi:hypothetical protein
MMNLPGGSTTITGQLIAHSLNSEIGPAAIGDLLPAVSTPGCITFGAVDRARTTQSIPARPSSSLTLIIVLLLSAGRAHAQI